MENSIKVDDNEKLEDILKALEEAKNVKDMIFHSRRAAVWVSRKNPGMSLFGPEVAKIYSAKNLDKSEFISAFIKELILQRRKSKIDNVSNSGLRTSIPPIKMSKFVLPNHSKPKLEKG